MSLIKDGTANCEKNVSDCNLSDTVLKVIGQMWIIGPAIDAIIMALLEQEITHKSSIIYVNFSFYVDT